MLVHSDHHWSLQMILGDSPEQSCMPSVLVHEAIAENCGEAFKVSSIFRLRVLYQLIFNDAILITLRDLRELIGTALTLFRYQHQCDLSLLPSIHKLKMLIQLGWAVASEAFSVISSTKDYDKSFLRKQEAWQFVLLHTSQRLLHVTREEKFGREEKRGHIIENTKTLKILGMKLKLIYNECNKED
ncbi:hypothetical protein GUJ93_ZPchr0002g23788 [Zizania palustris]|uniref:Uncharacterized protein n=1 Tax=Zizania palustris TaxID=103762 RepID=A0A8J5SNY2_ZIZPA|nr:hypothetical protein GUJ93_ZPchr0002g23788 [Zizania palustris]